MTGLNERDVEVDPIRQFERWWADAGHDAEVCLATATPDGVPSARMVLLKGVDDGFVFFTSYRSDKAADLEANPRAALVFRWRPDRQVRVTGPVQRTTREESELYWLTRPRGSQISASVSPQSALVSSRGELEAAVAAFTEQLGDRPVPLPAHWGGYRLFPEVVELWHHRDDRLHDRLRYVRVTGGWQLQRVGP